MELIRNVNGFIRFKVSNVDNSKFINICNHNGIKLWDICCTEIDMECSCYLKHYKQISTICKNLGGKSRIQKKTGLYFKIRKHKERIGFFLGIVLMLAIFVLMQNFIWKIDIQSTDDKEIQYISSVLDKHDVRVGRFISDIDTLKVQNDILIESDKLSWIALNISGTKIDVSFTLSEQKPFLEEDTPCNVVAEKDGYIEKLSVLAGETVVKIHQAVKKGDLLVSGIKTYKNGEASLIHADAEILAQTKITHEISIPLTVEDRNYTGEEKSRKTLNVFNVKIPLFLAFSFVDEDGIKYQYDVVSEYTPMCWFDKELPFGIEESRYILYTKEEKNLTQQEAGIILQEAFDKYEKEELVDVEILSVQENQSFVDGVLKLTKTYTCREDIAKKQKLNYISQ